MKTFLPIILIVTMLFIQPGDAFFPRIIPPTTTTQRVEVKESFKVGIEKAIKAARKADTITLKQAKQLRNACHAPAFIEAAHEVAIIQIAFSGIESPDVPVDADGRIQVAGINWEGLALFMEKLIPLIIKLIEAFGI